MKRSLAAILLAALLALASCGDASSTLSGDNDRSHAGQSENTSSAAEGSYSESAPSPDESEEESLPEESSTSEVSAPVEESSTPEESDAPVEESSMPEESDAPEDPGSDLFDYGTPYEYVDGYIYYYDSNYYLRGRVRPDGTDKTRYDKELKIGFPDFLDDRLVFISHANSKVYSMNYDGSNIKCLSGDIKADSVSCYPYIKYKDKLVFSIFDDDPRYGEYYIANPDGSDIQPIEYKDIDFDFWDKEWSYRHETFLDKRLYRFRTEEYRKNLDLTDLEKEYLTDFNILNFKMVDNVIYCIPHDELHPDVTGLWRVNTDGSDLKQLCDDIIYAYEIVDDYIYYSTLIYLGNHDYDYGAIYRMKTDGSEREQLTDVNTEIRSVKEGIIFFYENNSDNFCIMDINGNNKRVLRYGERGIYFWREINRYLFFRSSDDKLYVLDLETREFTFFSVIK